MKIKLLSFILFTISYLGFSQTTAIPDANFEQALIDLGIDSDGIVNGQILTSDAESVTAEPGLYLANKNISDLTGIEAFINVFDLECQNNNISNLDLSNLTSLFYLDCSNNNLSSLNIKNGNNTNLSSNAFNASSNPNLDCIQVDSAEYSNSNWTNIDFGVNFSTNCEYSSGTTNIPDSNFEQALIDWGIDSDGVINGSVFTSDISGVTYLNISYRNISDLTGIEAFTALTELRCQGNNLTSLNFSNNLQLKKLLCYSNNLSSLNISNNTVLEEVNANNNSIQNINLTNNTLLKDFQIGGSELTSIDVSNNNLLETLGVGANQISTLDISNNPNLTNLDCYFNQISSLDISDKFQLKKLSCNLNNLTSLDVSNNTLLEELKCGQNSIQNININNNTLLKILWVDSNELTSLDISNNTLLEVLSCQDNQLTSLNVNAHTNLRELLFAVNQISTINISNNTLLERLQCQFNQLSTLDVSNNTLLNDFNCGANLLTNLDISQNTLMDILWCFDNQLTSLDVSNNLQLTWLSCGNNQLGYLDLSSHSKLEAIECNENQLTYLNIKNGNNTLITGGFYFNTTDNPNLTCIQVDDPSYSSTNWTNIDAHTSFSEDCGIVWSSDSSDYANFTTVDSDADTFNWTVEGGTTSKSSASKGLASSGTRFFSQSWNPEAGNLTPDNLLITPTGAITVPSNASSISFKLNVEASSSDRPAEHLAIYVFDEAAGQSFDTKIHEETLTVGGSGTAKDITAAIPITFAGKNIGIIVRHFNTVGQDKLYVDDFKVSYEASTLTIAEENDQTATTLYPNPTKDRIHINTLQKALYKLTNINGQILVKGVLHGGNNTIDISHFQDGMYFLNINSNLGNVIKKIIKN
ncbi:T9SS type A sorting domain-containing protein [Tamlana crocina]|uniref:T9SS type A sorting domain-containing protein n=1 Tax=Tamlana crocina TaxID=393006 RepID=A0ABX1DFG3_9FLAO|nr:T9SS type A sorting domain-containing protein [Tamlana crocina]NJX15809.1 T9SS type A sorting domain-containing protein [Tamlana crocina]